MHIGLNPHSLISNFENSVVLTLGATFPVSQVSLGQPRGHPALTAGDAWRLVLLIFVVDLGSQPKPPVVVVVVVVLVVLLVLVERLDSVAAAAWHSTAAAAAVVRTPATDHVSSARQAATSAPTAAAAATATAISAATILFRPCAPIAVRRRQRIFWRAHLQERRRRARTV